MATHNLLHHSRNFTMNDDEGGDDDESYCDDMITRRVNIIRRDLSRASKHEEPLPSAPWAGISLAGLESLLREICCHPAGFAKFVKVKTGMSLERR
jgi:hypothetical protein